MKIIKSTLLSCLALLSVVTASYAQTLTKTIQVINVSDKSFQLIKVPTDLQIVKPLAQVLQPSGRTADRTKGIFSLIRKPDAGIMLTIIYQQSDNAANACIFNVTLSANEIIDINASPNGNASCADSYEGNIATLMIGLQSSVKN